MPAVVQHETSELAAFIGARIVAAIVEITCDCLTKSLC